MKDKLSSQEWAKEFQEFMSADQLEPPQKLTDQIFSQIHRDLHPNKLAVFSKLALIHAVVGTLTLLFCPYSELYSIQRFNLMNLFMNFGEQICMLGCGAFFLGASSLTASLILRLEEVQVIRKSWVLLIPLIALLSTSIFIFTGLLYLQGLFIFWALGTIFGGLMTLELGWTLRSWTRSAH